MAGSEPVNGIPDDELPRHLVTFSRGLKINCLCESGTLPVVDRRKPQCLHC